MIKLPEVLPAPVRPQGLPATARWLSGEGAGSWFVIEKCAQGTYYKIGRYSPDGKPECEGFFSGDDSIDLTGEYSLDYPSHCAVVTIIQGKRKKQFHRKTTT